MHKFNWDDLQIILAVARTGSASHAAASVGINHATVLRRIDAFENGHNVTLFDRHPSGMRPTPASETLLAAARAIDHATIEIRRTFLGQRLKLSGPIRLTATDSIVDHILIEQTFAHLSRSTPRDRHRPPRRQHARRPRPLRRLHLDPPVPQSSRNN
jgi:DNA-binding transcriptional LysR family regulator